MQLSSRPERVIIGSKVEPELREYYRAQARQEQTTVSALIRELLAREAKRQLREEQDEHATMAR